MQINRLFGTAKIIRTDLQVSGGERSSTVWHVIGRSSACVEKAIYFRSVPCRRVCPRLSSHRRKTLNQNCVARKLPSAGAGKVHLDKSCFPVSLEGTNSKLSVDHPKSQRRASRLVAPPVPPPPVRPWPPGAPGRVCAWAHGRPV